MKKIFTLAFVSALAFLPDAKSQCSSSLSYDLSVPGVTVLPPSPSSQYMSAYVCPGGTLIDSMMCCTRFIHVDSGGTVIVGPQAYGTIYLKSNAVFNGQNTGMSWSVFAEPGATVINYPGNVVSCTTVTFPAGNCAMSVADAGASQEVVATLFDGGLQLSFPSTVSDLRVELYDMNGRMISSESASNATRHTIDLSALPAGIYFCRAFSGEAVIYSEKIFVGNGVR